MTKPARILIIVQNLPVPLDRRVWLEATALTEAGYRVSVICPKFPGYEKSHETLNGIDIHRYPLPISGNGPLGFVLEFAWCFLLTSIVSFKVAIAGWGFDAIHACNPPDTFWLLARLWKVFGKPFLFDHHDLSPEMYAAKFEKRSRLAYSGLLFLERMTFATADVAIATNESHRDVAVVRGGMPPEKVYVVRSGPNLTSLKRFPPDPEWSRGKRHLLVYLGEMCKQDGVDHLIRSVKILRDDMGRQDFHCVFVGGGPHQRAMRAYAEEIGVAGISTFTGRVSDELLCRILSSAHVAVDPDPKNDWSDQSTMNKIMEYMYFGLPIVAFDLVETRRSAQEAASYAVPNLDHDLSRCILELLDDEPRRRQMGEFGVRRVHQELAWEYSVPALLKAYEMLFERGRRASRVVLDAPRLLTVGEERAKDAPP
jgi:glycosyltransferase involved in cell wall biosynthesis